MKVRKIIIISSLLLCCFLIAGYSQISVIGSLTRTDEAVPGASYKGTIILQNDGSREARARIYIKDYLFSADGTIRYNDPGTNTRSNADWLTFSPNTIVIKAGDRGELYYSVTVPDNPELKGTYWCMLLIEEIPENADNGTEQEALTIRQVMRFGMQIVTEMKGPARGSLSFFHTALLKDEGGKFFLIDIENTGERWLKPEVYGELYDSSGKFIQRLDAGKKRIYPGTSVRASFDISKLSQDSYKMLVIADAGGRDIFGGNYTLLLEN